MSREFKVDNYGKRGKNCVNKNLAIYYHNDEKYSKIKQKNNMKSVTKGSLSRFIEKNKT